MTNNEKSPGTVKASVSDGELLALLNMTGLKPEKISPLSRISGKPASPDAVRKLQPSGLTDSANRPTPACLEALAILASPAAEMDLLWGTPDGISLSKAYSAAGNDKLVSFTGINGRNNISYFLSSQDITDLLVPKLAFSEIKDIAPLTIEAGTAAMPVFFALLDIYRENQLRSVLERRQEFEVKATPEEVNRVLQEAKLETNLGWYAPVAYTAMPVDTAVTDSAVNEGLRALKSEGIIASGGSLSDSLTAFAYRAFPLAAFFGIKILTAGPASVEKTQLALFRGLSTLLLVQSSSENGDKRILINSISTSQLPEVLFNLAVRPFEITAQPAVTGSSQPAAPAESVTCGKCGTENPGSAKFCSKCGATLAAPPKAKFCARCGNALTAGEKFCKKCGTKLP
jgi:ribosomal protein L40E